MSCITTLPTYLRSLFRQSFSWLDTRAQGLTIPVLQKGSSLFILQSNQYRWFLCNIALDLGSTSRGVCMSTLNRRVSFHGPRRSNLTWIMLFRKFNTSLESYRYLSQYMIPRHSFYPHKV
nr:hypothetical protein B21J21.180 [imported] - Neurospora crassa [Neurospora crassa]